MPHGCKSRLKQSGGYKKESDLNDYSYGSFDKVLSFSIHYAPIIVLQGYGMTECTPLITGTPQSSAKTRYDKSGSVGVPVETGIVRIINPDAKGVGEIIYKGPNVMLGYYNLPEETSAVLEDGWLRTGDVGYFDKDGWLFLTGRAKNVIVTKAGENIYPEEIEDYINRHPSRLQNTELYFSTSISWSKISSALPAFRMYPTGFIFDVAGTSQ